VGLEAKSWEDDDINLRVAEKSENVLKSYDITSTDVQEE
jgi:hypothetical protein